MVVGWCEKLLPEPKMTSSLNAELEYYLTTRFGNDCVYKFKLDSDKMRDDYKWELLDSTDFWHGLFSN